MDQSIILEPTLQTAFVIPCSFCVPVIWRAFEKSTQLESVRYRAVALNTLSSEYPNLKDELMGVQSVAALKEFINESLLPAAKRTERHINFESSKYKEIIDFHYNIETQINEYQTAQFDSSRRQTGAQTRIDVSSLNQSLVKLYSIFGISPTTYTL